VLGAVGPVLFKEREWREGERRAMSVVVESSIDEFSKPKNKSLLTPPPLGSCALHAAWERERRVARSPCACVRERKRERESSWREKKRRRKTFFPSNGFFFLFFFFFFFERCAIDFFDLFRLLLSLSFHFFSEKEKEKRKRNPMPQHASSVVALEVLSSLASTIPARELASARGILVTRTHRAALGFGVQTGTAVAFRRVDDGDGATLSTSTSTSTASGPSTTSSSSGWSAPLVFAVRRASFGVSYGYATVDSVLLLKTDEEARLLAAGAPAFGTEHRFVSSVLDGEDDDENGENGRDNVEVEVEGGGLDTEVVRSDLAAAVGMRSGEEEAGAQTTATKTTATTSTLPPPPSSASIITTPSRSALLFSRSSGALVDMSVVAGMLSLDSAAHAALYCSRAPSGLPSSGSTDASPPSASASASASSAPLPPPPEPEDVFAGKVERPVAFADVYELLAKMEEG